MTPEQARDHLAALLGTHHAVTYPGAFIRCSCRPRRPCDAPEECPMAEYLAESRAEAVGDDWDADMAEARETCWREGA